MELSPYVEGLRRELGSLTRFAPEDVVRVAGQLAEALDSSVRLTLLDVLTAAAAEITTRLDDEVIEVRLSGGEPDFVVTAGGSPHREPPGAAAPEAAGEESGTARVTLRLSEQLKARVEAQAAAENMSVNSWLAHAAIRALENRGGGWDGRGRQSSRSGIGQRITGYAKS
jgi:HicB family